MSSVAFIKAGGAELLDAPGPGVVLKREKKSKRHAKLEEFVMDVHLHGLFNLDFRAIAGTTSRGRAASGHLSRLSLF